MKFDNAIEHRFDIVGIFEVKYSNPNGDPDADNAPRQWQDTGLGYTTDACLKSKIRKYVREIYGSEAGYDIYIAGGKALQEREREAMDIVGFNPADKKTDPAAAEDAVKSYMTLNYFDCRAFGSVFTSFTAAGLTGGTRGPVQVSYAESVDPIIPERNTITRQAVTKRADIEKGKVSDMGVKFMVPYALYRFEVHISAAEAQKTGFSAKDMDVLIEALQNMFELDRSAARAGVNMRKLVVFEHQSMYGNCPAHKLNEAVSVKRKEGIEFAKCFEDYDIRVDSVPATVTCTVIDC